MSSEPLLIKDAAKLLNIGSVTLYRILHEQGLLHKTSNLPRHDLVQAGIFRTELRDFRLGKTDRSWGTQKTYSVTLVTELGLTYLQQVIDQYQAEAEIKKHATT
jgi:phage antirepressor YoqD-like protein